MAAPTVAAATVLTLHTPTSSVPVGHVSDMTALGGSANLVVKGIVRAQVHRRVKVAHLTMTPRAVRAAAAAAVGVVAAIVGAVAAAAVMVEAHRHLLETEAVLPSVGILAWPVQVYQVLEPVQLQGARCCLPREGVQSFDAAN